MGLSLHQSVSKIMSVVNFSFRLSSNQSNGWIINQEKGLVKSKFRFRQFRLGKIGKSCLLSEYTPVFLSVFNDFRYSILTVIFWCHVSFLVSLDIFSILVLKPNFKQTNKKATGRSGSPCDYFVLKFLSFSSDVLYI